MIIFVVTVTTATLTIAVIESVFFLFSVLLADESSFLLVFTGRESEEVTLPIALGFDMKDREVCRWVDTTSDARCIKVVRFGGARTVCGGTSSCRRCRR